MRILRKNKRRYFGSLNNKIVTNNRKCWKTIIPLFFAFRRESIALRKSNKTITDNEELAETFNAFLSNIVLTFNINLRDNMTNPNIINPVFCAIKNYENHPRILKIKVMMGKTNLSFSFKFIDRKKIFKELGKTKKQKIFSWKLYTG